MDFAAARFTAAVSLLHYREQFNAPVTSYWMRSVLDNSGCLFIVLFRVLIN